MRLETPGGSICAPVASVRRWLAVLPFEVVGEGGDTEAARSARCWPRWRAAWPCWPSRWSVRMRTPGGSICAPVASVACCLAVLPFGVIGEGGDTEAGSICAPVASVACCLAVLPFEVIGEGEDTEAGLDLRAGGLGGVLAGRCRKWKSGAPRKFFTNQKGPEAESKAGHPPPPPQARNLFLMAPLVQLR